MQKITQKTATKVPLQQKQEEQNIEYKPIKISKIIQLEQTNFFGLCHCPGKQLKMGRDGKPHNRNIVQDVKYFKNNEKIDIIICLLNDYEIRSLGVDVKKYKESCLKNDIELIYLPIIEMATPECSIQDFDKFLQEIVISNLDKGKSIVCHCRGGIGRAGLLGACLLLKMQIINKHQESIQFLRNKRDKRCVESKKQCDYVKQYQQFIQSQQNQFQNEQKPLENQQKQNQQQQQEQKNQENKL